MDVMYVFCIELKQGPYQLDAAPVEHTAPLSNASNVDNNSNSIIPQIAPPVPIIAATSEAIEPATSPTVEQKEPHDALEFEFNYDFENESIEMIDSALIKSVSPDPDTPYYLQEYDDWDVKCVLKWLRKLLCKFSPDTVTEAVQAFEKNQIVGCALSELSDGDLIGMGVTVLGVRKLILKKTKFMR